MNSERLRRDIEFMECGDKKYIDKKTIKQLENIIENCRKKKDVDCNHFLQKKIRVNMRERKDREWSIKQAIAISYSQLKKMYPSCVFKRKNVKEPKVNRDIGFNGYSLELTLTDRRKRLDRLVSKYGIQNIVDKLEKLYVYNKKNNKSNALKFMRDMKYVQNKRY